MSLLSPCCEKRFLKFRFDVWFLCHIYYLVLLDYRGTRTDPPVNLERLKNKKSEIGATNRTCPGWNRPALMMMWNVNDRHWNDAGQSHHDHVAAVVDACAKYRKTDTHQNGIRWSARHRQRKKTTSEKVFPGHDCDHDCWSLALLQHRGSKWEQLLPLTVARLDPKICATQTRNVLG